MKTHKDLDLWKRSVDFCIKTYNLVDSFPKNQPGNLRNHICKSVVSIPSNIAEGAARSSQKEYLRFCYFALGSIAELDTQLIIAEKLKFFKEDKIFSELEDIKRMTIGLIRSIERKI
ncbi:MAG: four helix bundle protein [Bacteroidales bacterium]|nr:four helix bundle protein [Bacteroidales bacterium]